MRSVSWASRSLEEVLSAQAAERGSAEALVTPTARLTYPDLLDRAKRAAGGMRRLGLRKGDHVAILMGNGEKWLSLFYGAAMLGCVTVPVNTRFKAQELAFCLRQADCKTLFYARRFLKIDFEAMVREIGFGNAVDVTDGVPEALNAEGEEFGDERLKELVRQSRDCGAEEIAARISSQVQGWIGAAEQHDDITIVVMKL